MKGNSLSEIIFKILKQYPSFDDFKSQEYKKYFPKLTIEEIDKNYEEVKEFIQKLRGAVTVGIVGGSDLVKQEEQKPRPTLPHFP